MEIKKISTMELRRQMEATGVEYAHIDFTGEPFKCCQCREMVYPRIKRSLTTGLMLTLSCTNHCKQPMHTLTCEHDETPMHIRLADLISIIETGEAR